MSTTTGLTCIGEGEDVKTVIGFDAVTTAAVLTIFTGVSGIMAIVVGVMTGGCWFRAIVGACTGATVGLVLVVIGTVQVAVLVAAVLDSVGTFEITLDVAIGL